MFLGSKFSTEKCRIYWMFSTLTIGYLFSITVNVFLMFNNSSFEEWFKVNVSKGIDNQGVLFIVVYYAIS
jgi:hypothetical protein